MTKHDSVIPACIVNSTMTMLNERRITLVKEITSYKDTAMQLYYQGRLDEFDRMFEIIKNELF